MFDPIECEEREWIIPTGTGGYSSSSICGVNSRTYHGLLIIPQDRPHRRYLTLSKVEDFLVTDEHEYPLSTNHYVDDVFYPEGFRFLHRVDLGKNFVTWNYTFGNSVARKSLTVHRGYDAITLSYETERGFFRICPLVTFRSHHVVTKDRHPLITVDTNSEITLKANGIPFIRVNVRGDHKVETTSYWYYNFFYRLDYERGSNHLEDLFNPFCVVSKGNRIEIDAYWGNFVRTVEIPRSREILDVLSDTAQSFLVKGKTGYAIIAGYHWFDEWGRDTMIAMEGILLVNGLYEQAKGILQRYFNAVNEGLMPNNFLGNNEVVYKGVDIALWGINALYKYFNYTGDLDFVSRLFPKALEIVDWYWKGNGIIYNRGNLLYHIGAPRTWMDAQFDGVVVTPREGATVEVNALFYNALMIVDALAKKLGMKEEEFAEKADKVRSAFNEKFPSEFGLYDYIKWNGTPSEEVRPNQIFALSLPFPVVEGETAKKVISIVESELLRPYGLSTLSKRDPGYIPFYRGDRTSRDRAYHNGPVWPWLIGAYVDAKLNFDDNPLELKGLINKFDPLLRVALRENGFLPELFEDIPPYRMGGCIAQAWSVAEVNRALRSILNKS
ncbi:glycogen debranching protein [Metallosphaera tengchongensis]|uniref:Glycogen debranching protein n=1 Tax=Metallosphaera tengchongensis TaxID=1532350 RepID=A0A6N0NWU0_9CREN|nr:amylo-alpha-1,6-glucosidase [Metallosphaera tengchongensis]QKQ99580.1 glycogen debranching protein [Metallosphaera tengchongensis]